MDSSHVAVTLISDIALVSSKEFINFQAIAECRFALNAIAT